MEWPEEILFPCEWHILLNKMPIRSENFGNVLQMLNVEKLPIDGWIDK